MIEWFNNLSDGEKIAVAAIVVPVGIAIIGGSFKLLKWLWQKNHSTTEKHHGTDTPPPPTPDGIIHNLPYGSIGKLLKGRTNALKALHKQLAAAKTTAITQPAAIHGLGGVGKTRLAVEYALHSINDKTYTAALFVSADSIFSLNTNLAALAAPNLLNLPESTQSDQTVIVEAVIAALSHRNDWLLILDNVDNDAARQHICEQLLPRLTAGRIIITSRLSNWPTDIADLPVTKLSPKDAASYLRTRTKAKDHGNLAEQLAKTLDGLPVALEQAAAYINRTRITFAQYIDQFENSRTETLARYENLAAYDSPVLFTWSSTQTRLTPLAHTILRLSAFLAPDPIPTDLFESQPDSLTAAIDLLKQEELYQEIQPPDSPPNIREALAELSDWSMINLTHDTFTIHRLVQDAIRLTIPEDMQKHWAEKNLNLVSDYIPEDPPPDDVRSWPLWTAIELHVTGIIQHATPFNILEPTGRLMNELGLYLKNRIRFDEAEKLYRQNLAAKEKNLGPDHPRVARGLNNLAQLLADTNRLDEAEPLMKRVIKTFEKAYGENHPDVSIALNNLATLLRATNRLDQAEPLMRRALAIDEKSRGPDHPKVAIRLNNLALLLKATNRLDEAELLMKRVVKIFEKAYGKNHPNVATSLNNLAQLFQATNRLKEAEPMYRRALDIDESSLGADHPNVAIRLHNLASLLQVTNRLDEAKPLSRRALIIFENSLGPDHPKTITARQNLQNLIKEQQK